MRNILLSLLLFPLLALLGSCSSHKDEPDVPKEPVHRTVLVYMVATNDLGAGEFDKEDISEMVSAASDLQGGRLVIYHAPYTGQAVLEEILPSGRIDTLMTYDNSLASVSIERMRSVIADTKASAPADDYGLVLWSHSSGWLVNGIEQPNKVVEYSYGSDRGRKMNISALRSAIADADFSFIYFDCCLMGSVELIYELRDVTDYIVASPSEVPLKGMPYHLNIRPFFAQGKADLVKAASNTLTYYMEQKSEFDRSCSMAVYDMSKVDALAAATRNIYLAAETPYPQGYQPWPLSAISPYKNLFFDFGHYIEGLNPAPELLQQWQAAMDNLIVFKGATPYYQISVDLSVYSGLSTYVFTSAASATTQGYNTLPWYTDVASALIKTQD